MATTSILFACNMNSVRSPMAEALAQHHFGDTARVESCGVYEGVRDPFVKQVLEEIGLPGLVPAPQTFADVNVRSFDHVIALTPEAAAEARRLGGAVLFWETSNPTDIRGPEAELLAAYRDTRDTLAAQIKSTFDVPT